MFSEAVALKYCCVFELLYNSSLRKSAISRSANDRCFSKMRRLLQTMLSKTKIDIDKRKGKLFSF